MIGTVVRHRLAAPLGTAAVVAAAWAAVAAFGPHRVMPLSCPLLDLTGLACPFCGGLRSAHALAHGDLFSAAGYNVVVVAGAPVAAALWVRWVDRRRRCDLGPMVTLTNRVLLGLAIVLVAFAVVRNLPVGQWLAP